MASNVFERYSGSSRGSRSFYEELRSHEKDNEPDLESQDKYHMDEENLSHQLNDFDAEDITGGNSHITVDDTTQDGRTARGPSTRWPGRRQESIPAWAINEEDLDNDVPASLLVEPNEASLPPRPSQLPDAPVNIASRSAAGEGTAGSSHARWKTVNEQQSPHHNNGPARVSRGQPRSLLARKVPGGPREKALWRWVNTTNLDSFMRDVYDYFEGGGLWCILCSNALWLLETMFVAVLLTFLGQCVDYSRVPHSKSLDQVVIKQCTKKMSGYWSLGIWMYSFFFIWKSVQYFFEIRRLSYIRDFYIYLLDIPEQDMQTVSWQDVVVRVMALRDQNPKTALNLPQNLRRFIGSQSKERLDAHDIANRLMRKENYLIAMINKDLLNLSLPLPFLRGKHLFSKTMEWNLQFCILDMAFNEYGQVQQDFLRADRRGILSQKLKQRFFFAGCLNLFFAPIVLAYVVIVYFFTYYNEYQKDPKLATARRYTRLAEWRFREFNELPHLFYERLNMSYPFASRYVDQFPKRMTDEIARSIAFMTGAITAVLAVLTVLDSELFLGFEITKDRTVLFYLGVFGSIWAITRGMVTEETLVFNPEYAMRNVIEYTHYEPDHWKNRLHSFDIKQEFSELYKMKLVIFIEEVFGIITTSLLLLIALPKCSDQIVDFFREFTIHVDGLGYVCSFAVFDFNKGPRTTGGQEQEQKAQQDVREDYYSTKHGKMAASYYGFIDNYVINPKTGIPGHMPPGQLSQFHPPPAFPGLNSPTLAAEMQGSRSIRPENGRMRSRAGGAGAGRAAHAQAHAAPSPMASVLLDPHNQPSGSHYGGRSLHRSRHPRGFRGDSQIIEEGSENPSQSRRLGMGEDSGEGAGLLGESVWETSPGKGLSRDNSAANTDEPETGVLGMINQFRQTQRNRRGAGTGVI